MSAFLMFFYWIILPLGVFKLARWLFQRSQALVLKGLISIGTVIFFVWFLWMAIGQKMWLDHLVREMCGKNGGIKVYETVELPKERFDEIGNVHIPSSRYAKSEDEYCLETKTSYLMRGNPDSTGAPEIFQSTYKLIRQSDGKILGEVSSFTRRGGGLPGPWHPSSFSCPERLNLEKSIFKLEKK